ncbi:MAG TPA: VWA domain-containing protein [Acidimicrobiia bacterium]|nr:VWA domain-containing protein [Acidimicrobiia bacterium]
MSERPKLTVARRPLHFFIVADCSGSMAGDGRMRALNNAIREALPHLRAVAEQNPHAELLVRAIAFSTGARWHLAEATEVDALRWLDLEAGGYSDLGAGLELLAAELRVPPMPERALPPAIVLISDGMPTDDWRAALARLLDEPWGARSVRLAVGIGRQVDHEVLETFIGNPEIAPVTANNPEQLVRLLRWASTHAGRAASQPSIDLTVQPGDLFEVEISETIW